MQAISAPSGLQATQLSTVESLCSISSNISSKTPPVPQYEQPVCNADAVIEESKQFTNFIHLSNSDFHSKLESDKVGRDHILEIGKVSDTSESEKFSFYVESSVAPLASPELLSEATSVCSRHSLHIRGQRVLQTKNRLIVEAPREQKELHEPISYNSVDLKRGNKDKSLSCDFSELSRQEKVNYFEVSENIPLEGNSKTSEAGKCVFGELDKSVINSLEQKETQHLAIAESEYDISSFYDFTNKLSSAV